MRRFRPIVFLAVLAALFVWTSRPRVGVAAQGAVVNATTFHYDAQRTGWNPNETTLTPANVSGPQFGPLWNSPQFDQVNIGGTDYAPHMYASPLYLDDVLLSTGLYAGRDFQVVFAATGNGFVYAVNPRRMWIRATTVTSLARRSRIA